MRRFTRLTNAFSRKMLNHEAALGLYFAAYNFVNRHSSIKTTPAVAAGTAEEQWTIETLIERTAGYNPPTAGERFIDSLPNGGYSMRSTRRDAIWLVAVIAAGVASGSVSFVGGLRQGFVYGLSDNPDHVKQLRELETLRADLESANQMVEAGKRRYRNATNAFIRELEKDRGRIGRYSFNSDDLNKPNEWSVNLELLDARGP